MSRLSVITSDYKSGRHCRSSGYPEITDGFKKGSAYKKRRWKTALQCKKMSKTIVNGQGTNSNTNM
mgnify:CR=1 FL=1